MNASVRRISGLFWKPPSCMYLMATPRSTRASIASERRTASVRAWTVSVAPVTRRTPRPGHSSSSRALPSSVFSQPVARQVVGRLAELEDERQAQPSVGADNREQGLRHRSDELRVEDGAARIT